MYDGLVFGVGTLLDNGVTDRSHTAIRQVDAIAARTAGIIHDAAVGDGRTQRPALDLMPDYGVVKVAVIDHKRLGFVDVDIVRITVAGAVMRKLGPGDRDDVVAAGGENAVLVIEEHAVADGKVAGVAANTRAVQVAHGGTAEAEAVDGRVGVSVENALAVRGFDGRNHVDHAAYGLQRDPAGNMNEVVDVRPSLDEHGIPILGCSRCRRDGRVCLAGADLQCCHLCIPLPTQSLFFPHSSQ